jgi:hypothetical protein
MEHLQNLDNILADVKRARVMISGGQLSHCTNVANIVSFVC